MNRQQTLHAIKTTSCDASEIESLSMAGLETERRWLWVRCDCEPGPLSSELVASVSTPGGSGDGKGGEPGQPGPCSETHVWCSYQSPADVYRLLAEMVQSGVIIREARKLSPDMRTWPIDGVVGTGTFVVVEPGGAGQPATR
jgi:hypothetical protein